MKNSKTGMALTMALALTLPALAQNSVPMLVNYGGVLRDAKSEPLTAVAGVTFLLYKDREGGAPLWMETQNVTPDARGRYTVTLGATSGEGLPAYLFADGAARWLGVQVAGQAEEARVALVAVPYAMKAKDADTIGGLPPSAFVLAGPAVPATAAASTTKPEAARDISPDTACTGITSDGTATANQVAKFTAPCAVEPSAIFESGGKVGIGTTTPAASLDVKGAAIVRSTLTIAAKGAATATAGANSNPLDLLAASFNSSNSTSINQHFRWQAEAAGNDTANPSGTLNLLYAPGSGTPAETGLAVNSQGLFTFATGQTFPGAGTVTGVTAGLGLSGGGTGGSLTLTNTGVLAVAGGTGITSSGGSSPTVSLNTGYTDGRYLQLAGGTLSGALNIPVNGLTAAGNQFVLANGQVGINTATPSAQLEVAGPLKISGAGSALTFPDGTTQYTAGNPAGVVGVNPLQVALLKWFPANRSPNATFSVGRGPTGVAFDGNTIWVTNTLDGTVTLLLASSGTVVATYTVFGGQPYGIAFDGSFMWVAGFSSGNLTELQPNGETLPISLGNGPLGVAFDGANIWVTNHSGSSVTKIAASWPSATLGTYPVQTGPYGIAFDGTHMWVANEGNNTVTELLASSGFLVGNFAVGNSPVGVAFDGANIWVANYGSNTVTKLLASTGAVVGTYPVGSNPYGVAFDGTNIWVTNSGSNTVTKLLASSGATLGTFSTGVAPFGIAFDGANIWVANNGSNTVSKF